MRLVTMIASAFALAEPSVPLDPTPDEEREAARRYAIARGDDLRRQADFAGLTDDEIADRIYDLLVMLRPTPEEAEPVAPEDAIVPEASDAALARVTEMLTGLMERADAAIARDEATVLLAPAPVYAGRDLPRNRAERRAEARKSRKGR